MGVGEHIKKNSEFSTAVFRHIIVNRKLFLQFISTFWKRLNYIDIMVQFSIIKYE